MDLASEARSLINLIGGRAENLRNDPREAKKEMLALAGLLMKLDDPNQSPPKEALRYLHRLRAAYRRSQHAAQRAKK